MAAVILYNPNAGRGSGGRALAERVAKAIGSLAGESVLLEASARLNGQVRAALSVEPSRERRLLVCVGGDGTLHHALPDALATDTPVYVIPQGTENLFAREFGMVGATGERLAAALREPRFVEVDVGVCTPAVGAARPFVIMASFGPDASVIHRLDQVRRGPISHLSYVRPSLTEAFSPALRPLSVEVDGRKVVEGRAGLLVVANSRQYAARIDPAAGASMTDGQLDVVFMPAESTPRVLMWAVQARLRRLGNDPAAIRARGAKVRVVAHGVPSQVDGEAYLADSGVLELALAERKLRVLVEGPKGSGGG